MLGEVGLERSRQVEPREPQARAGKRLEDVRRRAAGKLEPVACLDAVERRLAAA